MDDLTPPLASVFRLPFALLVFFLPGWTLARRFGSPAPGLVGWFASAAVLFNLVLLLDALHLPVHAGSVGLGLLLVAAVGWKRAPPAAAPGGNRGAGPRRRWAHLWLVPPALALVSIAVRATVDPLSGYDNAFRWDYLARLVLAHGSLAGYPPVSAADFESYAWCDGIPPLVPLINFWLYAATGSTAPGLTAARILGEALLLGILVYRYANLLWGRSGGAAALAALSASALALWSVAMGQESGIGALSLVALLYLLARHHVLWAAVAAGVGALSRDYAVAFPVLGVLLLLLRADTRASAPRFAAIAAVIAAPWYLRNWVLTGNPLYPHTLGGLFPGNAVHDETMRAIADYWSPFTSTADAGFIPVFLAVLTGLLAVLGAVGGVLAGKRSLPLAGGILLVVLLWACSLPLSAGGWVYSARVLLPALALLAALAGWIGRTRPWLRTSFLLVLAVAAVDASRRSWLLPDFPLAPPASFSFEDWRQSRDGLRRLAAGRLWPTLVTKAAGAGIVVDHPAHHALVTTQGGVAVPLFSPALAPTFDDATSFEAALGQLRRTHIRFVVLTRVNPITAQLTQAHPFWRTLLQQRRPNLQVGALSVFDLQQPVAAAP